MADDYPTHPIRLIVPFAPGGPADVLARVISQKMGQSFGQSVVVENRPGGNTIIGAQVVARSDPDGYTLLMAMDSTLTMNQALYSELPYDPIKDFAPVALIATVPNVLVAARQFPADTVEQLVAYAKARPGQVGFAAGSLATQLGGQLFNSMAGVEMFPVLYKGGTTTISAVLSGDVPIAFTSASTAVPMWKAGRVKLLGALNDRRLSEAPGVPSISEAGLHGYQIAAWQSIVVPAGTPAAIIRKLNKELVRIMSLADTRRDLQTASLEPAHSTPDELKWFIQSESVKYGTLIKRVGMKVE